MPRFSINVSFMLHEHDFLDRFAAAADLGFTGVDIQFPYDHRPEEIAARARAAEFRAGLERALAYSGALGNRRVNVLAGCVPPRVDPERCRAVLAGNLALAAEACARKGVTVMVEPANGHDVPGYLLQTTEDALAAMARAGADNLMLQFDLYHRQVVQGDLVPALERHLPRIAHIQFADSPGRHEPGSGEIDFAAVFAAIDRLGYAGWVGAEYRPRGTTAESLGWFAPWRGHQS